MFHEFLGDYYRYLNPMPFTVLGNPVRLMKILPVLHIECC